MRHLLIGLPPLFLVLACGGYPPPQDAYIAAQQDVGRAEQGGAPAGGKAKLYYTQAQEHLQQAKQLMDNGDNQKAEDLINVSRSEAQLALSLAKEQTFEDQAKKAQDDLAKVKGGGQ